MKKCVILALVLTFAFYSTFVLPTAMASPHVDIDVNTAYQMIVTDRSSHPNLVILDVRTVSEFEAGHIPQAMLIPVQELSQRIDELSQHKNDEIVVYCRLGGRSHSASLTLDENNFTTVFDMLGGIEAWREAGYPIEQIFEVTVENVTLPVAISTNSSIGEFYFNVTSKQLSFNVTGATGTVGFCNVSIPAELMSGDFEVLKDDATLVNSLDYTQTFNTTHYLFSIEYEHNSDTIAIEATVVFPDFAGWLFLPFSIAATLLAFIFKKKTSAKKEEKGRREW